MDDLETKKTTCVVWISPLPHAKAPTLDRPDHRVEFMVRSVFQPLLTITTDTKQEYKYFYDFDFMILLTKSNNNMHTFL